MSVIDEHSRTSSIVDMNKECTLDVEILIPIKVDLSHFESRIRDHFLWPIHVFEERDGFIDVQSLVERNKSNKTIDLFALKFVEELDFPPAFDRAVAKSIRSQLEIYLKSWWTRYRVNLRKKLQGEEKTLRKTENGDESLFDEFSNEPKYETTQTNDSMSHMTLEDPSSNDAKIQANESMSAYDETSRDQFTLNEIFDDFLQDEESVFQANPLLDNLYLSEVVDEDEQSNLSMEQDDFQPSISTRRKRRRSQYSKSSNYPRYSQISRSKKVSVDEFYVANLRRRRKDLDVLEKMKLHAVNERILIKLDIAVAGVSLKDQFEWDPSNPIEWSDLFARNMCLDVGLPREFEQIISHEIRKQVETYFNLATIAPFESESVKNAAGGSLGVLNLQDVIRVNSEEYYPKLVSHEPSLSLYRQQIQQMNTQHQQKYLQSVAEQKRICNLQRRNKQT